MQRVKFKENNLDAILNKENLRHVKGIEVGHIFKLGQKYTEKMKTKISTKDSKTVNIFMGLLWYWGF